MKPGCREWYRSVEVSKSVATGAVRDADKFLGWVEEKLK